MMKKRILTVIQRNALIPLIIFVTSLFGNLSESEAIDSGLEDYSVTNIINTLTSNVDARRMYSSVFNQLGDVTPDIITLLEKLVKSSPKILDEVTRRWNSPAEKLSYSNYRKIFITKKRIQAGKKFHDKYRNLVHKISESSGVDEYLLLAIVGVESMYGASHSDYRVVDVFHTIAHDVPRKRKWAEQELLQYLDYCEKNKIEPGEIRGSYAAAIGYAQFIPSSLNNYGSDHDGDGRIDPYNWDDALESVANYLIKHRYDPNNNMYSEGSSNWKAIYAYNHSRNYVRVVLEFRAELKRIIEF